jgi:LPXTG-motif cell wall-anchored protein
MTYFRRSLGATGPITDPSQIDPTLPPPPPTNSVLIGDGINVKRVPCDQLPPDSLARQPGQVCGPSQGILDWILNLFKPGPATGLDVHGCTPDQVWNDTAGRCVSLDENLQIINAGIPAPDAGMSDTTKLLLAGGIAVGAYYFLRKKKRT